jgi:hypothetical protein
MPHLRRMSDAMTLAIVINLGLGALLLGLLALRPRRDTAIAATPEQALELFRRSFPDALGRATLASDGRGALIELASGGNGLLVRNGRRWNARLLAASDLVAVRSTDDRIELRFKDFAWPKAALRFEDAGVRAAWSARIGAPAEPSGEDARHA